jgi:hypothetical protein
VATDTLLRWSKKEIELERSPEDGAENLLHVLVSQLGEDDGDGEHGEAGVVLEPVPLVPRRQAIHSIKD